jgi:6-phosphogluconolactonase/glucosamine-6-phosphate isomerase/deaminase
MLEAIQQLIKRLNILSHQNEGILVAGAQNTHEGFALAKEILYVLSDKRTMLYLSGGRTPTDLYKKLADEEKLEAGAVGLVDERFGEKFHEHSNEKMLQDSGLLRYLQVKDMKFYPILNSSPRHSRESGNPVGSGSRITVRDDSLRKQTAEEYDTTVRELNNVYQKSIGILGVGMDGHTAGIAGNRHDFHNPLFNEDRKLLYVSEFDDPKGMFKERVSMTFLGLSMLDLNIVLVFGDDKKEALDKMFADGPEEDVPSRFFKRHTIAEKTLLITDQSV